MPYKDKEQDKEATKERMKRYRDRLKGVTSGVTKEQGVTTFDTPADIKAAITTLTGKWHPVDQWTSAEIVMHQARIREHWCCSGDWNAAYHALAPAMGWGRR